MKRRTFAATLTASLGTLLIGAAGIAQAETYPSRPIRIVLPFAAGSPTDALARVISGPLSKRLGQAVSRFRHAGEAGTPHRDRRAA